MARAARVRRRHRRQPGVDAVPRPAPPTQGDDSFAADRPRRRRPAAAGFDVLSLANNHVGDFGLARAGAHRGRRAADGHPAGSVPVGRSRRRAPAVRGCDGTSSGVSSATDSIGESPAAGSDRPGTNRLEHAAAHRAARPYAPCGGCSRRSCGHAARSTCSWSCRTGARSTRTTPSPPSAAWRRADGRRARTSSWAATRTGCRARRWSGDALVVHSLGNFVFDMDFMAETMDGVVLETTWWGDRLVGAELRALPDRRHASRRAS